MLEEPIGVSSEDFEYKERCGLFRVCMHAFVYVYRCGIYVCEHLCVGVCTYVCRPEVGIWCHLQLHCTFFP